MSRAILVTSNPAELTRRALVVVLGLGFAPLFLAGGRREVATPAAAQASATADPARAAAGVEAFATVARVLQHPRCLNCHPAGDTPLQYANSVPHAMNVQRGADDMGFPGQRCSSCHVLTPLPGLHMPPGVTKPWRLAPRALAFEGRSPAALAASVASAGMSDAELLHHVEHDPLVLYGWNPGEGRGKVAVDHADFVRAFRTWIEAGKPLPAE